MKRSYIEDLSSDKEVLIQGWVYEIRNLAKLGFLLIRDKTGLVQCIVKDNLILNEKKTA